MTGRETIVAAALCRNGLIYTMPKRARHGDIIRHVDVNHGATHNPFLPDEQGFITSTGRFVSRRVAAGVAIDAGQIDSPQWGAELYSEDLW